MIGRPNKDENIYWTGKMVVDETDAIRYLAQDYCDNNDTLIDFCHTSVTLTKKGYIKIDVHYRNLDNDKLYSWTEVYKDKKISLDDFGLIMAETIRRAIHNEVLDDFDFIFMVE